jgi:hypothetical protein
MGATNGNLFNLDGLTPGTVPFSLTIVQDPGVFPIPGVALLRFAGVPPSRINGVPPSQKIIQAVSISESTQHKNTK